MKEEIDITSISIKVVKNEDPVKAYCSIVIDGCFAVRKIRVVEKNGECHVFMPSMKTKVGNYADVCHPINQQTRQKIVTAILNAYLGQLKSEVV